MWEWIKANWELILICCSLFYAVYSTIVKMFALRKAKTNEEKQSIINDIKANVFGLIGSAEQVFSDVPKSGSSKLLYVLNKTKELCANSGIEYISDFWTDFINDIIAKSNAVHDQKAIEDERNAVIESIKKQLPGFIDTANTLFRNIPDSARYVKAYIIDAIEKACAEHDINVFGEYDWETYVGELMN